MQQGLHRQEQLGIKSNELLEPKAFDTKREQPQAALNCQQQGNVSFVPCVVVLGSQRPRPYAGALSFTSAQLAAPGSHSGAKASLGRVVML